MRFRSKKSGRKSDEIVGDLVGENHESDVSGAGCHLIQLSCGFLPIAQNSSIIPDGSHDVKMTKTAYHPRTEVTQHGSFDPSIVILADMTGVGEGTKLDSDDFTGDGVSASYGLNTGDTASATSGSESLAVSEISDSSRAKNKSKSDPIILQVSVRDCRVCISCGIFSIGFLTSF
jgi:hypothetical protein